MDPNALKVWDHMKMCNREAGSILKSLGSSELGGGDRLRIGKFISQKCFEAYYSAISHDKLGKGFRPFGSCSYRAPDICDRTSFQNGALGVYPDEFSSLLSLRKIYLRSLAQLVRCSPIVGTPEPFRQKNNTSAPLFGTICETHYN